VNVVTLCGEDLFPLFDLFGFFGDYGFLELEFFGELVNVDVHVEVVFGEGLVLVDCLLALLGWWGRRRFGGVAIVIILPCFLFVGGGDVVVVLSCLDGGCRV